MVAKFTQPDFTTQSAAQYKANIDASFALLAETGNDFACHQAASPNMTVVVESGRILLGHAVLAIATQNSPTYTAPVSNPRIDRLVMEPSTGAVSIVVGTEAASPVAPAVPFGKIPLQQVLLQTSTTQIGDSMITDERTFFQVPQKVAKRQCAQSGIVDANGRANFLAAGTGQTGTLQATAKPLVVAFALGYGAMGDLDAMSVISADQTNAIALTAQSTNYIYADYTSPSAMALGSKLAPPQWGDAYDRTKQSLLRFAGADASTTILDDYGNTWAVNGQAQIDTAVQIDGLNTLLLDGASDWIESTNFTSLGEGSWTLEAKVRWNALPGSGANQDIVTLSQSGGFGAYLRLNNTAGVIKLQTYLSSTNTSWDIASAVVGTSTTWATGTTYHLALTYDALAGKYFIYKDGVVDLTITSASRIFGTLNRTRLGDNGSGTANLNGAIAGFRFSPFCRYPNGTTFTPASLSTYAVEGDWFSTSDGKMYSITGASGTAGVNPTMTQVARCYLGEQDTNATVVTASRSYAYRGIYNGSLVTPFPATSTQTTLNHNIGVRPAKIELIVENVVGDQGYKPGDQVRNAATGNTTWASPHAVRAGPLSLSFTTQQTSSLNFPNAAGGVSATQVNANWGYRVNVERGF